jgi:6-methylsalicylate decarboxylase
VPGAGWIDVHHHSYHPRLVDALRGHGVTRMAPGVPLPAWTAEDSLRAMDRTGLTASVVSVLLPDGVPGHVTAGLVRQVNEWSAELVGAHPGRFGALACLPLPDVDAALAEIGYALDVLGLDGVALAASLPDGRLLGDPVFGPVFAELDRRGAVVFVHPRPGHRCGCTGGPGFAGTVPSPLVDFVTDTTRAVAGLLFGGTLRRCPDIRFVLAHAGGTVPYLAWRWELASGWVLSGAEHAEPEAVATDLRRLYFETAQSASPGTLACLQAVTDDSHILFGTDFPFMAEAVVAATRQGVCGYGRLDPAAVGRDNALRLFPRLRA